MSKKVLITGGSGDIAISTKMLLEKEGYIVNAPGRDVLDVTDIKSIEMCFSHFKPDVLINNAGYIFPQEITNSDIEQSKKQIEINLTGPFLCTSIGLKYNSNLDIINIGSAAAIKVHSNWSEYCAAKAGLVMATKCWSEGGIYSICLSPGRTQTKMRKSLFPDEDESTLLTTDDFAKVVLKAVRNHFISGSHIIVRKENVDDLLLDYIGG